MTDFSDWGTAARAVTDPSTSAADLAAIAQAQPGLRAQIAAHPNAYPGLLQWLAAQGDPAVQAVAASRLQPQTPIAAPMPVASMPVAPQQMPWGAPQPQWGTPAAAVAPQRRSAAPIIVAVAIIVLVCAIVGLFMWHPWQKSDTTPSSGNVDAGNIKVGACFTDNSVISVTTIKTVDCSQTHDSEVFFNQVVTSDSYPTSDQWDAFAQQYCLPAFASYVGIDYDNSVLNIGYYIPDSNSWSDGDKTLTCYATEPNGDLTSSIKNSGM